MICSRCSSLTSFCICSMNIFFFVGPNSKCRFLRNQFRSFSVARGFAASPSSLKSRPIVEPFRSNVRCMSRCGGNRLFITTKWILRP